MISMEHLQITVKAPTKPKRLDSSDAKNGGKQMQTERVSSNMGEQKTHRLNLQTGKYDNSEFPSLKKKKNNTCAPTPNRMPLHCAQTGMPFPLHNGLTAWI